MKKQILQPTYFEKFSCIGPACEDTCCAGWKVSVDKRTFQKYRKLTSSNIAKKLRTNVTRERMNPSDSAYAKINADENMKCAFLNEDKLCNIYIELGENYLCDTCTYFPRQMTLIDQRVERDLSVACPEAARLILLNPEGIDFVMKEEEFDKRTPFMDINSINLFWDIRMFVIQILQNRQASVEARLVVLGMFMEKLQVTSEGERADKLPFYINEYESILQHSEELNLHAYLPKEEEMLDILSTLVNFQKKFEVFNRRFDECIEDLEAGLQLSEQARQQSSILYVQNEQLYYTPFFKEKEYILENYLVNYVFKNSLPSIQNSFVKEYEQLFMYFLFIKGTLIGMAGHHQMLTEEMALKFIQSFTKALESNNDFIDLIRNILNR